MRVGFMIVFNGLHHLKHNDYAEKLMSMFDAFVFVEGAAGNSGSTAWCKPIPQKYHENYHSIDGTREFLDELVNRKKNCGKLLIMGSSAEPWLSKDDMCNAALDMLHRYMLQHEGVTFLWEVDADEQHTADQLDAAEKQLVECGATCGSFLCESYVGKNLVARGQWGEGNLLPYRRLWLWRGQKFSTHEPPELVGGNGKTALLSQRFKHYSYYFPQDVQFKEDFYTGHEGIFSRWQELQNCTEWPQPLSRLVSGPWGQTATLIHKISD